LAAAQNAVEQPAEEVPARPDRRPSGTLTCQPLSPTKVEPEQHGSNYKVVLIVATCFFAALALIFFAGSTAIERGGAGKDALGALGILMVAIAIGLGALIAKGVESACPDCRHWWARTPCGRKLIDKRVAYKTVTRTDSHSGSLFGFFGGRLGGGLTSGRTTRKEQVKFLRRTFRDFYECSHCGHGWDLERVEDSEEFEVDS
jgi:hypothetical protein